MSLLFSCYLEYQESLEIAALYVSITEAVMTDGNWREDPGDPVSALLFLSANPHGK